MGAVRWRTVLSTSLRHCGWMCGPSLVLAALFVAVMLLAGCGQTSLKARTAKGDTIEYSAFRLNQDACADITTPDGGSFHACTNPNAMAQQRISDNEGRAIDLLGGVLSLYTGRALPGAPPPTPERAPPRPTDPPQPTFPHMQSSMAPIPDPTERGFAIRRALLGRPVPKDARILGVTHL